MEDAKTRHSRTSYRRPVDVCSGRLCPTSLGRLLEFTVLRRDDVCVRRLRDQCMTSSRRLEDVEFFGGRTPRTPLGYAHGSR